MGVGMMMVVVGAVPPIVVVHDGAMVDPRGGHVVHSDGVLVMHGGGGGLVVPHVHVVVLVIKVGVVIGYG